MQRSPVAYAPANVLPLAKAFARKHGVDLAIPSCRGSGVGNTIIFTRLVEEYARSLGRPVSVATGPISPKVGRVAGEDPFAVWRNNPFVANLVDAEEIDDEGFRKVDLERKTLVQLNHVIENVCFAYGLRPRHLRASLFLSEAEMRWALDATRHLPRPLVCLHPGGNTGSLPGSPWHVGNWHELIRCLGPSFGFLQVGRPEFGDQDLGLPNPGRTLRDLMALTWVSDAFVGFDSSPMTIATAFEKPVVALFDMARKFHGELPYGETSVPSVMLRWAYPQNRNIALMDNDDGQAALALAVDALRSALGRLRYQV